LSTYYAAFLATILSALEAALDETFVTAIESTLFST
jgi:hypothetical protein